jgi:hypothetical protein
MDSFPRSLVGLWPVVLAAVALGWLIGEFNGGGLTNLREFALSLAGYLIR